MPGGGTEDAAAEAGIQGAEAFDLEGEAFLAGAGRDGSAAAADGLSGEEDLGKYAAEFGLPVELVVAGELGEVGEGLVERGIELAQPGQELMAKAVAGEGRIGVGSVFAPGLADCLEVGLDLAPADAEKGAEDTAGRFAGDMDCDDGVDAAEAFGPGSTEEFEEDGLGLVVHGVRGEDGIGLAGAEEGVEDLVTERAGGCFDGLAGGAGMSGDVHLVNVEGDAETGAEVLNESLVGVGFGATDAVMDMHRGETDSEGGLRGGIGGMECAEECDRICTSGHGGADAGAGRGKGAIEGEGWVCGHAGSSV